MATDLKGDVSPPDALYDEKHVGVGTHHIDDSEHIAGKNEKLVRGLHGRHMQMIAVGGAIGAGLFVGSGGALYNGGPASLLICFIIVGIMMLLVMQALAELAVMYPVNGAFFTYMVRFIDPSWGFAIGWDYAIQWLTILPFEITAAGITINYWQGARDINQGVFIAVFLVALSLVQIFGVRGYGEVEFVLALIKIIACTGFIIFGIVVDCGGVPTKANPGYIGVEYWQGPKYDAFKNGFQGFCTVFVTASFAYSGTELTGLAAAESSNPTKEVPRATKQVFWRITFFYIVNLFIVTLILPSTDPRLVGESGADTRASPFVLAINRAGVNGLDSVFNAVITIAVLSVANSATYGSTRTIQALAMRGMAPKILAYVDRKGRPIPTVILQLLFGCLAFVNEANTNPNVTNPMFTWLLALSGIGAFFVWGSICWAHIRFRGAWKYHGHDVMELPYKAPFGIWGSAIGVFLNVVCVIASFYTAVWPLGGIDGGARARAKYFFESFLAGPLIIFLYLAWKLWSFFFYPDHRPLFVRTKDMDIYTGMREEQLHISGPDADPEVRRESIVEHTQMAKKSWYDYPKGFARALI